LIIIAAKCLTCAFFDFFWASFACSTSPELAVCSACRIWLSVTVLSVDEGPPPAAVLAEELLGDPLDAELPVVLELLVATVSLVPLLELLLGVEAARDDWSLEGPVGTAAGVEAIPC